MSICLVSFEDAEWQLNDDVIHPDRIAKLIERASGIVLANVNPEYPGDWEIVDTSPLEYDIPQAVQQVTLSIISELNQNRENPDVLSSTVIRMLQPWRTPTLSSSPDEDEE